MTQVDFHEIDAPTPDYDEIAGRYRELASAFDNAPDAAARREVMGRWDTLRRELDTWGSLVGVRFHQDTRDEERKAALTLRDELGPKFNELQIDFMRRIRQSPHRDEIAAQYGPHLLDLWDCVTASYDPAIEDETVAEAKTGAKYTELLASASFEFQGETLNLSTLGKYAQHADRDLRYQAAKLRWDWFGDKAEELDRLYDELVKLRMKQSDKLGYAGYTELGYKKMGRTDYGPDDVARYRQAVLDEVVPLCARIRERQRESLGVDELMGWDEQGNPPE